MRDIFGKTGCETNFMSSADLSQAIDIFRKFDSNPTAGGIGVCHGLDQNHQLYPWFKRQFISKLNKVFDTNLNLVFAMYLDLSKPFAVHSDIRPCTGQLYASCLIPCSVDNDPKLTNCASTNIFNEIDTGTGYGEPPTSVTLQQSWQWNRGDLVWWDTRLFHNSGDFVNFTSKQAIVIHTYV